MVQEGGAGEAGTRRREMRGGTGWRWPSSPQLDGSVCVVARRLTSARLRFSRSISSSLWRCSASASAIAICFIISPSRLSSFSFMVCACFCASICSARTLPTSARLIISSSSRRSSSASIRRIASCCFWYHRSSASTSRSRCRCFTSICRSRSSMTSASMSFECSDLTRSVES